MKQTFNEREIMKVLRNHPLGVNVRETSRKTEVSRPTVIKILRKFEEEDLINYPKSKKGKESKITLKKLTQKRFFRRVRKQEKFIDKELEEPIIIKTKDGETYAGIVDDECEGKSILLIGTHLLDYDDDWEQLDEIFYIFEFEDISEIYGIKLDALNLEHVHLTDVLELWNNPDHDIIKGTPCKWGGNETEHSVECETKIHEALSTMMKTILYESTLSKSKKDNALIDFKTLVKYIVLNGGKIPYDNW